MPNFLTETLLGDSNISMGTEGIEAEGETTIYEHTAIDNGLTRTVKLGMVATATAPILSMEFHSPAGLEVLSNGGFEDTTSALAGWTKTTETGGAWSESTTIHNSGGQSAKWDPSADANFGQIDLTDRRPVIALNAYRLSGWCYFETNVTNLDGRQINVLFYDAETGGNLLATELLQWEGISADTWIYGSVDTVAPAEATYASVRVIFSHNGTAGGQGNCYVDDVSLVEVDVDRAIQYKPDLTAKNGRFQFPNNLSLRGADTDHLALTARHKRPLIITQTGGLLYFGGAGVDRTRIVNSTTKTAVASTTIRANSLGRRGNIYLYIFGDMFNNSGASRNLTVDIDFGGSNVFSDAVAIAASASFRTFYLTAEMANNNLQESQFGAININTTAAGADSTFLSFGSSIGKFNSSIDTKVDQTFTVSFTWSFASNNLLSTSWGWFRGPIEMG